MAEPPDDSPVAVLAAVAAAGGPRFRFVGRAAGGESSAAVLAADRRGRRLVVKAWPGAAAEAADLARRLGLAAALRDAGWPVPALRASGRFGGRVLVAWEWVAGRPQERLTAAMVELLVSLAAAPRPEVDGANGEFGRWLVDSLRTGCDGYCVHGSLAGGDRGSARLLDRVRAVGAATEPAAVQPVRPVPVHVDLHHRNVLWRSREIAAVVDWEGAMAGDAAFDLVTLAFGLERAATAPAAREHAWRAASSAAAPAALRAFAAHMALRQVDWSIRHRDPADVAFWLDVSTRALDRVEA